MIEAAKILLSHREAQNRPLHHYQRAVIHDKHPVMMISEIPWVVLARHTLTRAVIATSLN